MATTGRRRISWRAAMLGCTAALSAAPGGATTLAETVAAVRAGNPEIAAQRAQVAADATQIAIARAPARPRLQAGGTFTQGTNGANVSSGFDRTFDANLSASLPIYDGGAVRSAVAQQRLKLTGSRATAAAAENQVVTDAITAYADIVRDREVVALVEENLRLLDRDLAINRERLRAGDVTRTDVSQNEARQAQAISRLADAQTRLASSEESYRRLVGSDPGVLAPLPPLPRLPGDRRDIEDMALAADPRIAAARGNAEAAEAAIRTARAAARPTLTVRGGGEYHNYEQSPLGYTPQRGGGAEGSAVLAYPIYQGGLVHAQIAQARALATRADFEREATGRTVATEARTALARYAAAQQAIVQSEKAVALDREALSGTQVEAKEGERTVLDVLNADMELLDAQVALATVRHDSYLAGVGVMTTLDMLGCFDRPTAACAR